MAAQLVAVLFMAANAEPKPQSIQIPLPIQPIQRPLPVQLIGPHSQGQLLQYTYTARTAAPVHRSGGVTANGIMWTCAGSSCAVTGPWPNPGVSACATLAREVGTIIAYGRSGVVLNIT